MTEVKIVTGGEGGSMFVATIDGTTLPIAGYVAEPGDRGQLMVSLVIRADALRIGEAPSRPVNPNRNEPPTSTWGDPGQPDPRANIPGWNPPPAAADAHRGRHELVGDGPVSALRRLIGLASPREVTA